MATVSSEEEREAIRERWSSPSNCRMVAIRKSRLGRQGDLLVVERDQNFSYSVSDYTPTERREDNGQGAPKPHTMALRIVKDRVKEACEEGSALRDRMTAKEVWEHLVEEMNGQLRKAPSAKTVKRWLDRWVEDGVMVRGKYVIVPGSDKPVASYTLPPSSTRVLRLRNCPLVTGPQKPLQTLEKATDKGASSEGDVHSFSEGGDNGFADARPDQKRNGHGSDHERLSIAQIPVPEGDLGEEGPKDISKQTKEEPHGQGAPVQATPSSAPEVDQGDAQLPVIAAITSSSSASR